MNLPEEQNSKIVSWINEGYTLSQIQQALQDTFNVSLTYRDVRFLVDDLGLSVHDNKQTAPAVPTAPMNEPVSASNASGGPQVSVDAITRPGAAISGQVTFRDGVQAGWQLDPYGRIGIIPPQKGYAPPKEDLAEFQTKIQAELQRLGY